MKKTYEQRKAEAQAQAIEWQLFWQGTLWDTMDIVKYNRYFTKLGKRYGLIREFRENGVI